MTTFNHECDIKYGTFREKDRPPKGDFQNGNEATMLGEK